MGSFDPPLRTPMDLSYSLVPRANTLVTSSFAIPPECWCDQSYCRSHVTYHSYLDSAIEGAISKEAENDEEVHHGYGFFVCLPTGIPWKSYVFSHHHQI